MKNTHSIDSSSGHQYPPVCHQGLERSYAIVSDYIYTLNVEAPEKNCTLTVRAR